MPQLTPRGLTVLTPMVSCSGHCRVAEGAPVYMSMKGQQTSHLRITVDKRLLHQRTKRALGEHIHIWRGCTVGCSCCLYYCCCYCCNPPSYLFPLINISITFITTSSRDFILPLRQPSRICCHALLCANDNERLV